MECHITPLSRQIGSPCQLGRYGSLLLALFLVLPPCMADPASPQGASQSASYGSQMITLNDGQRISVATLHQMKSGIEKDKFIDDLSDEDYKKLDKYLNALKSEANARIAEKKAALTLLDATDAAMKAVLDPKCITDDRLPDAVQRRKEIGAMFDAALQNSHLTSRFSGDTTTLMRSLAEKLRLGESPKRMSPENFAKWSKEKSKCLVDAR